MRLADWVSDPLPEDSGRATLVGRVWDAEAGGPCAVAIRDGEAVDITVAVPTMRDLCEADDPAALVRSVKGRSLGALADILTNTPREDRNAEKPWLLAPVDLQAIKAAGVTFVVSMLPPSEATLPTAALVALFGIAQLAVALRVSLDAALFRRLANDAAAERLDVGAFDAAMLALKLMRSGKAGQPIAKRFAGARRLLVIQGAVLVLQVVAAIVGGSAVYFNWA